MHTTWKRIVLESYPKVNVSPEREIVGMGALIDKRQSQLREVSRAVHQKQRVQRHQNIKRRKPGDTKSR